MIVFEVRDDRHHRFEQGEGAVRLVGLGNEPRRASFVCVTLQREIDAAENEARIDAARAQRGVHHRRGRRLSVRSADGDTATAVQEARQHLAAAQHRNPAA